MDAAVSLVQAYLRTNGFFTVAEYPILERAPDGRLREATDLDILAIRLSGGGRVLPRAIVGEGQKMDTDPLLDVRDERVELIVAEVKEGVADPNRALLRHATLREALRRFGAVPRPSLDDLVQSLREHGEARWDGHRARLMIFASRGPEHHHPCTVIPLGHVVRFLEKYIEAHHRIGGHARFRDTALSALALRAKAMREPEPVGPSPP